MSLLGTNTEFVAPPVNTGVFVRRWQRYRLQRLAGTILLRGQRLGEAERADTRVYWCSRVAVEYDAVRKRAVARESGVDVYRHKETHRARFRGLAVCGKAWKCPVCAGRIAEVRRRELKALREWHESRGDTFLVTLTVPHYSSDRLSSVLEGILKANRRMQQSQAFKRLRARFGLVGKVRSLEVTYGEANGWHPHFHELWLLPSGHEAETLQAEILQLWQMACVAVGLPSPDARHGVNVVKGKKVAEYIAKWGLEEELTKWHLKAPKQGRYSPLGILAAYDESTGAERRRWASRFLEYVEAFHGKSQLHWSRGLKAAAGIMEQDDEQAASSLDEMDLHLANLTLEDFRMIKGIAGMRDRRDDVIQAAETEGEAGVRRVIEEARRESEAWLADRARRRREVYRMTVEEIEAASRWKGRD